MIASNIRQRRLVLQCLVLAIASIAGSLSSAAGCYGLDKAGHQTRFRVVGSEAHDTLTGLVWQRCSFGTKWDGQRCAGRIAYLNLDEALASATEGWHVPSGPELESLVDTNCGSPVVDQSVFPDIRPDEEGHAKYWTTNDYGRLNLYWNFDFVDGNPDANSRGVQLAVRFVRTKRD